MDIGNIPEIKIWKPNTAKLLKSIDQYQRMEVVGVGTYGHVYRAVHRFSGQKCAIKQVRRTLLREEGPSKIFNRQLSILRDFKHPNIVSLKHFMINEKDDGFMVFEFMETDLYKKIKAMREQSLSFSLQTVKGIVRGILEGIAYSHNQHIMHRDLKPANILLNPTYQSVKIADFGVSRAMLYTQQGLTTDIGTLSYRAPETFFNSPFYGKEIDLWAIGCIMAECVLKKPLFDENCQWNEIIVMQKIIKYLYSSQSRDFPVISQIASHRNFGNWIKQRCEYGFEQKRIEQSQTQLKLLGTEGLDVLNGLLQLDYRRRLTAEQTLKMQFFTTNSHPEHHYLSSQISKIDFQ